MNSPTDIPTLPPLPTPDIADGEDNVGVLFHAASIPGLAPLFAADNPFVLLLAVRGLEMFLREPGLCGAIGACGDLNEGVVLFGTKDRPRALAATMEYLEATTLLNIANIYDWHASELVWRAYHTADPGVRLEDFTTAAAMQRLSAKMAKARQVIAGLKRQFPSPPDPR